MVENFKQLKKNIELLFWDSKNNHSLYFFSVLHQESFSTLNNDNSKSSEF